MKTPEQYAPQSQAEAGELARREKLNEKLRTLAAADKAKAEARLRAVTEALADAIAEIDNANPGAWANGNTDEHRTTDEGEIMHARSMKRIRAALTAARSADLPPHPDTLQLRCLLARIHRDGGHHTEENGVAESCAEADRKVVEMLAALDAARAQEGGAK